MICFVAVPKPMTSIAVTTMKNSPPKITVPRIARGTSLRGFLVSSPRVAAPSKPANDKNPKTTPRKMLETSDPPGIVNTLRSNACPAGAEPETSLTKITTATIRMSSTVTPSTTSINRVPPCADLVAKNQTTAKATSAKMKLV